MARQSRNPGVEGNLILVRAARQLVTLHGPPEPRRGAQMSELAIIPDGALLVRNGVIDSVGTTRRVERLKAAKDAVEVDATGSVVMPAFVDTATEIFYGDPKRSALDATAGALLSGMVRHGTLTAEVLSLCDMRLLRICAALQGRPATLLPSLLFAPDTSLLLLETAVRLRLVKSATVLVQSATGPTAQMRQFLAAARALGLHTSIQAAPGFTEPAAFLAFDALPDAVGGLQTLAELSVRALAREDFVVTCLQARLLIDSGGAFALGTHFHHRTSPNYNMPDTLATACRECRITPAEAVMASTLNAAYAAGCASKRGSLEPGKWADLVLYDCRDYADIVRNGAINQVSRVLRQGKTVYRRGKVDIQ